MSSTSVSPAAAPQRSDETAPGGQPGSRPARNSRRAWLARVDPVLVPTAFYAVARLVALMGFSVAALVSVPRVHLAQAISGWDTGWYLAVARSGYPRRLAPGSGAAAQSPLGFFPLHPLAIRLVHLLGLGWLTSGIVVCLLGGWVAVIAVDRLAADVLGPGPGRRVAIIFAFFPGAYVLDMAYSEGLFLALAATCLLALRRRRWLLAGVLAALASAARPNGGVLAVCCLVAAGQELWRRHREDATADDAHVDRGAPGRRPPSWAVVTAPVLGPLGLVAFFAYLHVHVGTATAYLDTQRRGWGQHFDGGAAAWKLVTGFLNSPFADINRLVSVLTMVVVLVGAVLLWRIRIPVVLAVFAAGIFLPAVFTSTPGALPRHALSAFPIVFGFGARLRGWTLVAAVGFCTGVMALLAVLSGATYLLTP